MRAILEILADAPDGQLRWERINGPLREQWAASFDAEDLDIAASGAERWWNYAAWGGTTLVYAGVLTKGNGTWSITPFGRQLLAEVTDPDEFLVRARQIAADNRAATREPGRRAWLVRGATGRTNLLTSWLDEGWCSVGASQLGKIEPPIERPELERLTNEAYGHLPHQQRVAKTAEIVEFVTRIRPGDLVITTSDKGTFVGEFGDGWEYQTSVEGESSLRRPVEWRNADTGIDFGDLPPALQAKLRTGAVLADFTAELDNIDGLGWDGPGASDDISESVTGVAPHVRFDRLAATVAADLLVGDEWLGTFVDLLNASRQVVLYGPPGTGKTYLARKIAEHLVGSERTRLVQFHPSYTYEDFFEGYRPADDGSGGVSLELRAGPLRRLATEAIEHPERAFVMIIDELNRANIAKVFGELYFLLEYRDDAVEVMYGGEPFTLPKNLHFIATMNTADRSIALLDSAMRRRFTFLELHPATEPTAGMLAVWLLRNQLPPTGARLLELVNAQIDDHDAHIGPSYLMTSDQSEQRIRRVFDTQIRPLLRETYYDRWSAMESRFEFDRLWAAAGAGVEHDRADDAGPAGASEQMPSTASGAPAVDEPTITVDGAPA